MVSANHRPVFIVWESFRTSNYFVPEIFTSFSHGRSFRTIVVSHSDTDALCLLFPSSISPVPVFIMLAPNFLYPSIHPVSHPLIQALLFPSACLSPSIYPPLSVCIHVTTSISLPPPVCRSVSTVQYICLPFPIWPYLPWPLHISLQDIFGQCTCFSVGMSKTPGPSASNNPWSEFRICHALCTESIFRLPSFQMPIFFLSIAEVRSDAYISLINL